jgi:hypothetical protein
MFVQSVTSSTSRVLRALWDAWSSLDGLEFVVQILGGVACIGFVGAAWLVHWVHEGRYLLAICASISVALLSLAAIGHVPIALIVFFGVAVVLGGMFVSGTSDFVLP